MVSSEDVRTSVGILGNIISLFLFLSPLPTFIRIWKKGSVEQYSATPYLATLLNCMLWCVYGLPQVRPDSTLVLTINGSGCAIELAFLIAFVTYAPGRGQKIKVAVTMASELVLVAVVGVVALVLVKTQSGRSTVVGIVSILFNIVMYASPLAVMKLVIKTKSVEYMPFVVSATSLANTLCWGSYALIRFDLFMFIPNAMGVLFSVIQLLLHATYYKSTQEQVAARKTKGELALGHTNPA